jgi:hypothetical protein
VPRVRVLVLAISLAGLAGCFTADGTLDRDGSGRLVLTYFPARHATVSGERQRFSSPHVTVESLEPSGVTQAVVRVRFDDPTRLASAEAFRNVTVTREQEADAEVLRIAVATDLTADVRTSLQNYARANPGALPARLALALPGRVLAANRDGRIDGSRVVWEMPLEEYASATAVEYVVRFAR